MHHKVNRNSRIRVQNDVVVTGGSSELNFIQMEQLVAVS